MTGLRLRALELAVAASGSEPVIERAKAFLEFLQATESPSQPPDILNKHPESIGGLQPGSRQAA